MPTTLYLIRHAETSWNKQKRYCGIRDIALSAQGMRQAEKLKKKLKNIRFHAIYCSDRKRAIQTARLAFGNEAKITPVAELREICFGVFEGLSHAQNLKRNTAAYKRWLTDPTKEPIPKGEKIKAFKTRVLRAFKKIIRSSRNKTIAVVTHGGVISIFTGHVLNSGGFWKHLVSSASVNIFEHKNGKISIKSFNDTEHLYG